MHRARLSEPLAAAAKRASVLYLVNQYPAVTHTFIKREILALERLGVEIIRVAARSGKELVDPGDIEEERRTFYLLRRPLGLIRAAGVMLILRPRSLIKSLVMSLQMMRRSDRGPILHVLYLLEACRVASLVRVTGATHIHAHFGTNPAEVAMLASELCGATYSFTVHGYDEYDKPEFLGLRVKIRRAAFVAAVSHYGRSQLYRWCDGADRGKIKLIRCGIEQQFHQTAGNNDTPCDAARFVCVGRLCREKGQDILIKAAALMAAAGHQFEIILVGDGEVRAELEALIGTFRLSEIVRLRGWMSSEDVRREMIDARALVVASLAENLPVVIMEAMTLRRTVVATQIAGIPELVVPDQTGWLVPAGSVEALATAMTECLLASREKLSAMGRRGRERVLMLHNIEREAAALADLFATEACPNQTALQSSRPLSTAVQ
ncbi:glycosyltransferase family 4 protein [Bradyrhizobium sp. AS23.2]|uniref:glycosyltransferase family 4 protein n=1 Tax=Bradyrhizobium sp. AS23.2 TaxID=1680155 RepID=UPI00093F134B|nr:glycosyltransferase family 4 protein [Bradyrhizobium sp. AS23.2]OKO75380.1 hypothetical protein AC630_24840 [Bradyrhizobium sp. AS23.2]